MKVDLRALKVGDTVHFRCGGSAVVSGKVENTINFEGYEYTLAYDSINGTYELGGTSVVDIIQIEKKAFDWKDAKQGMAFYHNNKDSVLYFIAHDFLDLNFAVLGDKCCEKIKPFYKGGLIRAPEHDLVIVGGDNG